MLTSIKKKYNVNIKTTHNLDTNSYFNPAEYIYEFFRVMFDDKEYEFFNRTFFSYFISRFNRRFFAKKHARKLVRRQYLTETGLRQFFAVNPERFKNYYSPNEYWPLFYIKTIFEYYDKIINKIELLNKEREYINLDDLNRVFKR